MARTDLRTDRSHIAPEYSDATWLPHMDQLGGMQVRDVNGDKVGTVDDSYTDDTGGYLRYIAVKTGWFGTKRHMIPVDDIRMEGDGDDAYLVLPYDKDHLREGPTHERDEDFTREHESAVYGHYGRDAYWDEAIKARQTAPAPIPEIAEMEAEAAAKRGDDPRIVATKRWGV
jgi:sporulation protein YlmC with PRC-barrel domain